VAVVETLGITREKLTPEDIAANIDAVMDMTDSQLVAVNEAAQPQPQQ
jgi:hypothetical protein